MALVAAAGNFSTRTFFWKCVEKVGILRVKKSKYDVKTSDFDIINTYFQDFSNAVKRYLWQVREEVRQVASRESWPFEILAKVLYSNPGQWPQNPSSKRPNPIMLGESYVWCRQRDRPRRAGLEVSEMREMWGSRLSIFYSFFQVSISSELKWNVPPTTMKENVNFKHVKFSFAVLESMPTIFYLTS